MTEPRSELQSIVVEQHKDTLPPVPYSYQRTEDPTATEYKQWRVEIDTPMNKLGSEIVGISQHFPVKEVFFVQVKVGTPNVGLHNAPSRRFVIYLSGEAEQETSDGEVRKFGPGDVVLFEDTTGKGHISRNLTDRFLVMVTLV